MITTPEPPLAPVPFPTVDDDPPPPLPVFDAPVTPVVLSFRRDPFPPVE